MVEAVIYNLVTFKHWDIKLLQTEAQFYLCVNQLFKS